MSEWWLPLVTGLGLGTFFFAGLWWTVRRSLSAAQPALWFLCSLVTRTAVTLAGFYLVSAGDWQRLLACLLGFTVARFLVMRIAGTTGLRPVTAVQGPDHAP
jgi:F1F0 ATPase subunit 2